MCNLFIVSLLLLISLYLDEKFRGSLIALYPHKGTYGLFVLVEFPNILHTGCDSEVVL